MNGKKPNTNGGGTPVKSEHTGTFKNQVNKSMSNNPENTARLGTTKAKDVVSKKNPKRSM